MNDTSPFTVVDGKAPAGKLAGAFYGVQDVGGWNRAASDSLSLSTHIPEGIERLHRMRDSPARCDGYRVTRRQSGDFTHGNIEMSSSNLAERMERPATDNLSDPPCFEVRAAANDEQALRKVRPRMSFTNRKFVVRDQGLQLFRIR